MLYTEFADHVRYLTKTNTTTLTDAEILRFSNIYKDDFADSIEERNESYFDMEMVTDLIVGQRQYSLPDEWMNRIIRLSVNLDGTDEVAAKPIDLSIYTGTLEELEIQGNFNDNPPSYGIRRRSLYILTGSPITAQVDGLRLWSKIYPANFVDLTLAEDIAVDPTSISVGLPRQFHELLARRVAIAYKQSRDRLTPPVEMEQRFDVDFGRALDAIAEGNLDTFNTVVLPVDDGSNY